LDLDCRYEEGNEELDRISEFEPLRLKRGNLNFNVNYQQPNQQDQNQNQTQIEEGKVLNVTRDGQEINSHILFIKMSFNKILNKMMNLNKFDHKT